MRDCQSHRVSPVAGGAGGNTRSAIHFSCGAALLTPAIRQRVAKLNLKNIILRTLGINADPATYFTKYMYPRQGISLLYEGMSAEVRGAGNVIKLNAPAVRLERQGEQVARVVYREDGQDKTIDCDILLSTLPLPALVTKKLMPVLPIGVLPQAASKATAAAPASRKPRFR